MGTELDAIEKRIAELQARRDKINATNREAERKRDVRRRIIIGGGVLGRAAAGDREAVRLVNEIRAGLDRPSDQKAFGGWAGPGGGTRNE